MPERNGIAQWLAYVCLVSGAFAFGAVYPWAYWPLALLCAASGVAGLYVARKRPFPADVKHLVVALALVVAAAVLQVLPLPANVLGASSPRRLDLLTQIDGGFARETTALHPLSLDPSATIRGAVLYVAFALLMIGLARRLSRTSVLDLLWVIAWLGIALAVTGIIQRALGTELIYGFWKPPLSERPFGPFVNKNHFAGWMLMAIPLVLGYLGAILSRAPAAARPEARDWLVWLSSREANQAAQAALAVILMGLALVLTLSRSGMLSLAVALIFWACLAVRYERGAFGRSAIVGGLMSLSIVIVVLAGTDAIAARFASPETTDLNGRIPIWRGALNILQDFWLTGSGLNTYGVTTLFYPAAIPGSHFREAHNDYLQLAVEGGLLLGMPIAIAAVTFAHVARRRFIASNGATYWIRLGALAGIVAVAVQSVVEFSLQIPGNAALFATLCGIALHRDRSP